MAKEAAQEAAQQGETLRLTGYYSEAVRCFSKALEGNDGFYWAKAHRGAARAGLGNFAGAKEDLEAAIAGSPNKQYLWAKAHLAETLRLQSHEAMTHGNDSGNAGTIVDESIKIFNEVVHDQPDNAWAHAHLGAARTTQCWLKAFNGKAKPDLHPDGDFKATTECFAEALAKNPGYTWARDFQAINYSLHGQMTAAREILASAQANGSGASVQLMSALAAFTLYAADHMEGAKKQEACEDAVSLGWQILQRDSDNAAARYFIAQGLTHLTIDQEEKEAAIQVARQELLNAQDRIAVMLEGLNRLSGQKPTPHKPHDLRAWTMRAHDPVFRKP